PKKTTRRQILPRTTPKKTIRRVTGARETSPSKCGSERSVHGNGVNRPARVGSVRSGAARRRRVFAGRVPSCGDVVRSRATLRGRLRRGRGLGSGMVGRASVGTDRRLGTGRGALT